jgi:hypothetical protein
MKNIVFNHSRGANRGKSWILSIQSSHPAGESMAKRKSGQRRLAPARFCLIKKSRVLTLLWPAKANFCESVLMKDRSLCFA